MLKVIVGSNNPVKLGVTKEVFEMVFPNDEFEFIAFGAESGVSDQPMDSGETRLGAKNRTLACQKKYPEADYFVGLEGGLEEADDELWSAAWMCVMNDSGEKGFGKTSSFLLPSRVSILVKRGMELAHAGDEVFNETNIGQKGGVVSVLTKDVISRKDFYRDAMVFALIPFINPDIYCDN